MPLHLPEVEKVPPEKPNEPTQKPKRKFRPRFRPRKPQETHNVQNTSGTQYFNKDNQEKSSKRKPNLKAGRPDKTKVNESQAQYLLEKHEIYTKEKPEINKENKTDHSQKKYLI